MTDLKIRRIPFDFDGVDFVWNADDPAFAITMNKVSFFAVGFEKYICQAMRDAEPLITDPRVPNIRTTNCRPSVNCVQ